MLRVGEELGKFAGKDEMLAADATRLKLKAIRGACALTVRTASLGPACDGRGAKRLLVYDAVDSCPLMRGQCSVGEGRTQPVVGRASSNQRRYQQILPASLVFLSGHPRIFYPYATRTLPIDTNYDLPLFSPRYNLN